MFMEYGVAVGGIDSSLEYDGPLSLKLLPPAVGRQELPQNIAKRIVASMWLAEKGRTN